MSVYDVELTQGVDDWVSDITFPDNLTINGTVGKDKSIGFAYDATTGAVTGTVK